MTTPKPSTHVPPDHLATLTVVLRGNLEKCASDPDVDPVHDLRTGTRRVQATVEALLRERGEDVKGETPLAQAGNKWLRHLKKLRRAAGPVRDLDVHRKILKKLVKFGSDPQDAQPVSEASQKSSLEIEERPVEASPAVTLEKQAEHLDAWLHHARQHLSAALKKKAAKELAKFDVEAAAFASALQSARKSRRRPRSAAVVALEAFVRLDDHMRELDADNLHDFRKGAKKARYIAESAAEDAQAIAIGKALKKLQDEIGDWHDWLVLADEAHSALSAEENGELITLIDAERDRHYTLSMKTVARLRGKLLGEWISLTQAKPRHTTTRRVSPGVSRELSSIPRK